jgi:hypothetical protein
MYNVETKSLENIDLEIPTGYNINRVSFINNVSFKLQSNLDFIRFKGPKIFRIKSRVG